MTAIQIIEQASADGVTLALAPSGSIKATGEQNAINRWLSLIRDNKPGIVEVLTVSFTAWRWLVHFADREPVEVYCDPHETHAGILKCYPDALAAEPIPERIKRRPTESETVELTRLVRVCGERYDFTEAEHAESLAIALADPSDALTCFRGMAVRITGAEGATMGNREPSWTRN